MFKVSLLPASYKKYLEGKKKKDLVLKVALLILMCMLIIYAGFMIRSLILKGQYRSIQKKDSVISAQINDLQQYKSTYDGLVLAQERVEAVKSRDPSAVKFMTTIKEQQPAYIEITSIALSDWSNSAICAIEGRLPAAQTLGDAVRQLDKYAADFKENPAYNDKIVEVKVVNDMPITIESAESGNREYGFIIYVSLNGPIAVDDSGVLITTTTTTTTAPAETTTAGEGSGESTSGDGASESSSAEETSSN